MTPETPRPHTPCDNEKIMLLGSHGTHDREVSLPPTDPKILAVYGLSRAQQPNTNPQEQSKQLL
jgi:hypothetical protein